MCCCCCSVAQLCLTLCDPMACSRPGLPVPHHVPKFAQAHVHCMGDAIQPSFLWCCLLILPSIFAWDRDFPNGLAVLIRWPKYWSFSFSISPSNEYSGLISFKMTDWISLLSKGLSGVFSSTTVQRHQFFGAVPSLWSSSHNHTWSLGRPLTWLYGPLSAE